VENRNDSNDIRRHKMRKDDLKVLKRKWAYKFLGSFVFIMLGMVLVWPGVVLAEVSISLTGSGWDAGIRGPKARVESASDAWKLTNNGTDTIVVSASVVSSGTWTASDDGTPGVNKFVLGSGTIVIPPAGTQISPVLSANDTYDFGLWLTAPAKGSTQGGYILTVTLTASAWAPGDSFVDPRDGTTYTTVEIGGQCWMQENLRYLPDDAQMVDNISWGVIGYSAPQYAVYGVTSGTLEAAKATANYQNYGALYNHPAALLAVPAGWRLPTDAEYKTLEMSLGMTQADADATGWRYSGDVGNKLRSEGTGWTNTSGFTGKPGGHRNTDGSFHLVGSRACFWSSSPSGTNAWRRLLYSGLSGVYRSTLSQALGFSVRCLRD
jgi:uncharacterized protein (TIGR02145 family)